MKTRILLLNSRPVNLFFIRMLMVVFIIVASTVISNAKSTTWLPTTGGLWTTAGNWSNGVPAANDDVIINSNQSANITAVPTITLNSLTVSGNCLLAAATSGNRITITTTFYLAAGTTLTMGTTGGRLVFTLNGTGTVNGHFAFDAGTTVRDFTVAATGTLIVNPPWEEFMTPYSL